MFLKNPPVRIVRVGHNGEIGIAELTDILNLGHDVAGQRGGAGEFPIGRAKHGRSSRRYQRRYRRQQNLRAGGRNHAIRRWCGISLGGDCGQAVERGGLRQPRK